jgi:hypothetical protein
MALIQEAARRAASSASMRPAQNAAVSRASKYRFAIGVGGVAGVLQDFLNASDARAAEQPT